MQDLGERIHAISSDVSDVLQFDVSGTRTIQLSYSVMSQGLHYTLRLQAAHVSSSLRLQVESLYDGLTAQHHCLDVCGL